MALLESDLQRAIIRWSETLIGRIPEFEWIYHCPNGGKRNAFEAQNLKSQGVKSGVVDLHLDVARGGYHGWKCELKKPGGNCQTPSEEQIKYLAFVDEQGYCTLVSNDFDEVKEHLLRYIGGGLIRDGSEN